MEWNSSRPAAPRLERERSRVTLQLQPHEKKAIDWLSRFPKALVEKLPPTFRPLAGTAARTIARELSGEKIRQLAALHAKATTPPT